MPDTLTRSVDNRMPAIEASLRQRDVKRAAALLEEMADPQPAELVAMEALANILQDEGKTAEAIVLYLHLAQHCPANADVFFNVGNIFRTLGRLNDAADAFRESLALNQNDVEAWQQLGTVLQRLGDADQAVQCFRSALAVAPDFYQVHIDLGNTLRSQGKHAEAMACYRQAVQRNPDFALAQYNLAVALMECGLMEQAIEHYRLAIARDPKLVEARWNCALCMLATGNFEEGWRLFEARLEQPPLAGRHFEAPRWQNESLDGKDILVHAEQGFGDTLQFARYVCLLGKFCKPRRIILECQPELQRLLQSLPHVSQVVVGGVDVRPRYDFHVPLLSLPLLFHTRLDTIPARTPYLTVPQGPDDKWRDRLAGDARKKVGLAWAGRPTHPRDARRTLRPAALLPLLEEPGICFVSLQAGVSAVEAGLKGLLLDCSAELEDFADTAALVSQLDLVICVDTAVAHLAGALGKPVWLLNPWESEWRWMRDMTHSPWYPSMTIFRQSEPDRWDDVLQRVAADLQRMVMR